MPDRRGPWLIALGVLALAALAGRVLLAPRPLDLALLDGPIGALRLRIALAGLVMGAGVGLAAVASQVQARDARVDASLAGPLWGALPGLLVPAPVWVQALVAVAGAGLVTRLTGARGGGLPMVLTRGLAVAGALVSLTALVLFLGPGLTATTALAFLHAALGGALTSATPERLMLGAALVVAAGAVAVLRWRELLLTRTGLGAPGAAASVTVTLASAGSVLVAGVVPGLGLLAVASVRHRVGEHPLSLAPAAALAGATIGLLLDGLGQAWAWPGELPVGISTTLVASLYLAREVLGR